MLHMSTEYHLKIISSNAFMILHMSTEHISSCDVYTYVFPSIPVSWKRPLIYWLMNTLKWERWQHCLWDKLPAINSCQEYRFCWNSTYYFNRLIMYCFVDCMTTDNVQDAHVINPLKPLHLDQHGMLHIVYVLFVKGGR